MNKAQFYWLITYFKPNGKYYTTGVVQWECRTLDEQPEEPYYHDAVAKLRGLRTTGRELPGLCGSWDGPMLIERAKYKWDKTHPGQADVHRTDDFYGDGVPHLIL